MKDYPVKEIKLNCFFTQPLYLEPPPSQQGEDAPPAPAHAFIITAPEMPFTNDLAKILERWSFETVYSDGDPRRDYTNDSVSVSASDSTGTSTAASTSSQPDSEKLAQAEEFYATFQHYVDDLFIRAAVSDELDLKNVLEQVRKVVDYVREDRRFLMRVLKNIEPAPDKSYMAAHSVRSTILSIIIGTYLKLPAHRMIELGIAALVHEIGMLKLPQQIYLSNRPLTPPEQKAIVSHPILGYSILKSHDFPLAVCLTALEHHERENGTGYPRRLSGDKISLYSKIIAVACSYEALSSKRPHKEAKDGYTGMLELLKNEGKRYDDTVVRALVLSLSIYPIGLYVLLSNGKKGQVVDVNPENPRFPIVQIFGEVTPDGRTKTEQTAADGLTIVRPLKSTEIEN